jgi:HlyD family secretion protein
MATKPATPKLSYRPTAVFSMLAIVVLFGGSYAWSITSEVEGAVLAPGSVVVKGQPKSVQHLDGGIVESIAVAPGDEVEAGTVLIELDPTGVAANLDIYRGRLREALVRISRLDAELVDQREFAFVSEVANLFTPEQLRNSVTRQSSLMLVRQAMRSAQLAQFDEKISQFENQVKGVTKLIEHKQRQIDSFNTERASLAALVTKELLASNSLMAIDRSISDTLGQLGEHEAEIARITNSIVETRLSKLQVEREFQQSVISEIEETRTRVEELKLQIEATAKQLERTVIRSPVAGTVHELNVFTVGGIIQPGQTVMQIVPRDQAFEIQLTVDTRSVDQVFAGQPTMLRFPAFNQRTTPQLQGKVAQVSPSSIVDERTGKEFYRITVALDEGELESLGESRLVPGMPVEGYVQTGRRLVLSYLTKPFTDNLERVFREE